MHWQLGKADSIVYFLQNRSKKLEDKKKELEKLRKKRLEKEKLTPKDKKTQGLGAKKRALQRQDGGGGDGSGGDRGAKRQKIKKDPEGGQ